MNSTASRLRSAYILRRSMHIRACGSDGEDEKLHPKWDGGRDSRGVVHRGVWDGLAAYAESQNLDPEHWVASLFDLAYKLGRFPWPSDLKSEPVLKHMRSGVSEQLEDLVCAIRAERMDFLREVATRMRGSGLSQAEVEAAVIVDPAASLSAFTRYVAAVASRRLQLAAVYFRSAKLQYLACPDAYDRVFSSGPTQLAVLALKEASR